MISRRQFFRFIGGLGALGASTAAYGFGEPLLQLRVARYDLTPTQWPAGFQLKSPRSPTCISGGLGCSIMPFRLGVPPEIVLVTLGGTKPAVA